MGESFQKSDSLSEGPLDDQTRSARSPGLTVRLRLYGNSGRAKATTEPPGWLGLAGLKWGLAWPASRL